MPPGEAPASRVEAALALILDQQAEDDLEDHVRWELEAVLKRLRLTDFTVREVMTVLAVLTPIHSRVIREHRFRSQNVNDGGATVLHIIRD